MFQKPVTVTQLARATGYSRETVHRNITMGLIPAGRLSPKGSYRIQPEIAERIVRQVRGEAPEADNR